MTKDQAYYDALAEEYNALHSIPEGHRMAFLARRAIGRPIVAEGDSWFDYGRGFIRAGRDIIHQLADTYGHSIKNVARAGDTLENMVYGTKINRRHELRAHQWQETKRAIEQIRPDIFLFSGGGYDFAKDELAVKVNHQLSGRDPIRLGVADYMFNEVVPSAFRYLFQNVWAIDDRVQIIIHGYANARPDGRGLRVYRLPKTWMGPWLRPYLASRGITHSARAQEIVTEFVRMFNVALSQVAAEDSRVHYLDLRDAIEWSDWDNELHLTDEGYAKVARIYDAKIKEIRQSVS